MTRNLRSEIRPTPDLRHHQPPRRGKTTLTEKLLLFGGAIQMAGAVKARKAARHATSDWMAIERERGISVTSLGDEVPLPRLRDQPPRHARPPGLSEDTYRVLSAVDSAVMVIDSVKGVEPADPQTDGGLPDAEHADPDLHQQARREGMKPLDILADIEETLQIECAPLSWPNRHGEALQGDVQPLQK